MTTKNISNFNIATLNALKSPPNTLSNITINNSIKIPYSPIQSNSSIDNSNAGILFKDINSNGIGEYYPLKVDSFPYSMPYLYFNNNLVIDTTNLLSELEDTLSAHTLDTSNIIVTGGYLNFANGGNSNVGADGVGLRYSTSNTVQFKNANTGWIDLADITTHDQFSELNDVDVASNPLINNQFITYNASSAKFVNSNLDISLDTSPVLGGNLYTSNHEIFFGNSNTTIHYTNNTTLENSLIQLKDNTTITGACNYLQINNADITGATDPEIKCQGTNSDIGLIMRTKGTGHISLNASQGNVYANSDSLIVSGYVQNSVYRTTENTGGYVPDTNWTMPLTNDTVVFNFDNSNSAGTYYANVVAGVDGQKLNLVYYNSSANSITVLANFGVNGIISSTGLNTGIQFQNLGQSANLIYLGGNINLWQVFNSSGTYF